MKVFESFKQYRSLRLASYLSVAVGLYAMLGFLFLPWLVKDNLSMISTDYLGGREIQLQALRINPFALSVDIEKLAVKGLDGEPFVGFDLFRVNFQSSSLFRRIWTFKEIGLVNPYQYVNINQQGEFNFVDLLPGDAAVAEPVSDDSAGIPEVLVLNLHIDNARWFFHDASKKQPFSAEVGPINIKLNDFTTKHEENSPYRIQANTGGGVIGSELVWQGFISINPLSSRGKLTVADIDIEKIAAYFAESFNFSIDKGLLDISAEYSFEYTGDTPLFSLSKGELHLKTLQVSAQDSDDNLLDLPSLLVKNIRYQLSTNHLRMDAIRLQDMHIEMLRENSGAINLQQVFSLKDTATQTPVEPLPEAKKSTALALDIASIQVLNNSINFTDKSLAEEPTTSLSAINFQTQQFNLLDRTQLPISLDLQINQDANLALKGHGVLFPEIDFELMLALQKLALANFQAYIGDAANIRLVQGALSADLQLNAALRGDSLALSVAGDAAVTNLQLQALHSRAEIFSVASVYADGLQFDLQQRQAKLKLLRINAPKVSLIKDKSGLLNVEKIAKPVADATAMKASAAEKPMAIDLAELRLENAQLRYADYAIAPYFQIELNQLTGTVKGLSSNIESHAKLNLDGKIDSYAPVKLSGELNLLSKQVYADIILSMKNINMSSFTPYSGTYIGRAIDKGKLNVGVNYFIENGQLRATNDLFLDQFELGQKVTSSQALNLPVGLGVSLLKNNRGEINIDLPIKGDLNDPEFRYGKLVWAALGNVIIKAAASPFKLLAGLVGSDADLGQVFFTAGAATIDEANSEKLALLEQALLKRPELSLEIQGCFSRAYDQSALQYQQLQDALNPQAQALSRNAYHKRLREHYQLVMQQKPEYQLSAELTAEERLEAEIDAMQQALMAKEEVALADLQALAQSRSRAIQQVILASGEIAAQRIFITAIVENKMTTALSCQLKPQ